jgi:hypothetical protein
MTVIIISQFWQNMSFEKNWRFWQNFTILINFESFERILKFWQNFKILTKLDNFYKILQLWQGAQIRQKCNFVLISLYIWNTMKLQLYSFIPIFIPNIENVLLPELHTVLQCVHNIYILIYKLTPWNNWFWKIMKNW